MVSNLAGFFYRVMYFHFPRKAAPFVTSSAPINFSVRGRSPMANSHLRNWPFVNEVDYRTVKLKPPTKLAINSSDRQTVKLHRYGDGSSYFDCCCLLSGFTALRRQPFSNQLEYCHFMLQTDLIPLTLILLMWRIG